MSKLKLATRNEQKAFRPGEEIAGAAGWELERAPKSAEVRLFWRTRGKGTEDVLVVEAISFPEPQAAEARPFQFRTPDGPYSFSGKLISLIWALELVVEPDAEAARLELVISPTGQEILLPENVPAGK